MSRYREHQKNLYVLLIKNNNTYQHYKNVTWKIATEKSSHTVYWMLTYAYIVIYAFVNCIYANVTIRRLV